LSSYSCRHYPFLPQVMRIRFGRVAAASADANASRLRNRRGTPTYEKSIGCQTTKFDRKRWPAGNRQALIRQGHRSLGCRSCDICPPARNLQAREAQPERRPMRRQKLAAGVTSLRPTRRPWSKPHRGKFGDFSARECMPSRGSPTAPRRAGRIDSWRPSRRNPGLESGMPFSLDAPVFSAGFLDALQLRWAEPGSGGRRRLLAAPGNGNPGAGRGCLRLNVWTPEINGSGRRPVMVYMHGGGYEGGFDNDLLSYDGENLSRNNDVVVVTHNHRLNVFGFPQPY